MLDFIEFALQFFYNFTKKKKKRRFFEISDWKRWTILEPSYCGTNILTTRPEIEQRCYSISESYFWDDGSREHS